MKWPFVLQSILLITLNGYTSIPKRLFAENDIVLYRYIASLKTLQNDFYSISRVNIEMLFVKDIVIPYIYNG